MTLLFIFRRVMRRKFIGGSDQKFLEIGSRTSFPSAETLRSIAIFIFAPGKTSLDSSKHSADVAKWQTQRT